MAKAETVKEGLNALRNNQIDKKSEEMIFQGCTQSQLVKIFRMDRRDIAAKLAESPITPCGARAGYPIYAIHEVAPYLVKPLYDIETHLKRMHHNDLPKHLSKEFWAGMRAKQEYQLKEGELWPTEQVIAVMGNVFKRLRMSMLLIQDAVEREHMLTAQQRDKISSLIDGALNDMADDLVEQFKEPEAEDDEL